MGSKAGSERTLGSCLAAGAEEEEEEEEGAVAPMTGPFSKMSMGERSKRLAMAVVVCVWWWRKMCLVCLWGFWSLVLVPCCCGVCVMFVVPCGCWLLRVCCLPVVCCVEGREKRRQGMSMVSIS
jgi:hypothetical protein